MDLREYILALPADRRDSFARDCGTTFGHLRNVAGGYKPCAPLLATQIEQATGGAVRRWHLRPDDWARIWPELIGADGAPAVPADVREVA